MYLDEISFTTNIYPLYGYSLKNVPVNSIYKKSQIVILHNF